MDKGKRDLVHEEATTILSVYESNTGAVRYVKQKLTELKGKIPISTIAAEDSNAVSQQWKDPGIKPAGGQGDRGTPPPRRDHDTWRQRPTCSFQAPTAYILTPISFAIKPT